MSLPKFPDKDTTPSREEVVNQIISSIAMEELGLSHIINSEDESFNTHWEPFPAYLVLKNR